MKKSQRAAVALLAAAAASAALAGPASWPAGATTSGRTTRISVRRHPVVFVANRGSGTVTPISTATNRAGKLIQVGRLPQAIAITPDYRTAFVAAGLSGTVTQIRIATRTPA
jgi:YVTN family beta-propeller protein